MQTHGYIQLHEAIDRALDVFADFAAQLSADDLQLKRELELIRLKIVRAEAGTPSSAKSPAPPPDLTLPPVPLKAGPPALPPDLTKAPWSR